MPCAPRMRGCGATCGHRALVESYRDAVDAWDAAAEAATMGYATELREYAEANPRPTFKQWLEGQRGSGDADMHALVQRRLGIGEDRAA